MSKIRLFGTSSGYVEIAPAAAAGNNTLTAPSTVGEIIAKDAAGAIGITSMKASNVNVGAAVTITESGIEASGIGITCASINDGQISGRRNIVINGAMMVSQRGNQSATSSAGYFACDRFYTSNGSDAAVAVNQSTDSPDDFGFSYHLDCTTADTSIAAGQYFLIQYRIEGQDIQRFNKGTSSAKQFALSFYVKATKTGLYTVELEDTDNQRQISKTINVTDTNWNRYVLIFPADTSGAFNNDQNSSLTINWWLLAGSTYNGGTVNTSSWASITQANRASGSNVNAMDSTSNDFRLTGVQLEVGDQATSFEHRSFGEELSLCQRYYQRWKGHSDHNGVGAGRGNGTSGVFVSVNLIQCLRASPSITNSGIVVFKAGASSTSTTDTPSLTNASAFDATACMFPMSITGLSGITNNYGGYTVFLSNSDLQLDAEM